MKVSRKKLSVIAYSDIMTDIKNKATQLGVNLGGFHPETDITLLGSGNAHSGFVTLSVVKPRFMNDEDDSLPDVLRVIFDSNNQAQDWRDKHHNEYDWYITRINVLKFVTEILKATDNLTKTAGIKKVLPLAKKLSIEM